MQEFEYARSKQGNQFSFIDYFTDIVFTTVISEKYARREKSFAFYLQFSRINF
jgi:hypothetical protein